MSNNLIQPIPKDGKRDWTLEVNGQPCPEVQLLDLHSRFGCLRYGQTPAGFDSCCIEEIGGGGSVIIPYVIFPGPVAYVGLVMQARYTTFGHTWNAPRGFLNQNETHFQAAVREAGEELGFDFGTRINELPGEPMNPNSEFFVTKQGEGVHFFRLEIYRYEIEEAGDAVLGVPSFRLRPELEPASKTAELIHHCRFVPALKALELQDMFTVAGIGRLLLHLSGRLIK